MTEREMDDSVRRLESALADLRLAVSGAGRVGYTPIPGGPDPPRPEPPGWQPPRPWPGPPPPYAIDASRALKFEAAERIVERIQAAQVLEDQQLAAFEDLARGALNENLRVIARGGGELAVINITVTGTATISV